MKLRVFAIFALVVGVALLVIGAAAPMLSGLPMGFLLLGGALSLSALFCLVFTKTAQKHCRVDTSLVAVSLGAVGGAGLVCFLVWLPIAVFGGRDQYPVAYPYSLFLGAVCFFAFLGLCALYVVLRKKNSTFLGVLLDVLTSILYLPGFFLILFCIMEFLRK